jgi:hypothetical protein
MPWDCPKCGLVNPPESQVCDCGYDAVARQVDPRRAPAPAPVGCLTGYKIVKLAIAGLFCTIFGLWDLAQELSQPAPELWGILRAIAVIILALVLLGLVLRKLIRSY